MLEAGSWGLLRGLCLGEGHLVHEGVLPVRVGPGFTNVCDCPGLKRSQQTQEWPLVRGALCALLRSQQAGWVLDKGKVFN